MLNLHHLFYSETGSVNATGFNSAQVLQVFNMQLSQLLSVQKHRDSKETICINNILQNVSVLKDEASDYGEL